MNLSLTDDSSLEKAIKISGLLEEELLGKIAKEKDARMLEHLRLIYFQRNEETVFNAIGKRIVELGGTLTY